METRKSLELRMETGKVEFHQTRNRKLKILIIEKELIIII